MSWALIAAVIRTPFFALPKLWADEFLEHFLRVLANRFGWLFALFVYQGKPEFTDPKSLVMFYLVWTLVGAFLRTAQRIRASDF